MALPSSSATSAASTATTTASLDGRTDRLSFDESRGEHGRICFTAFCRVVIPIAIFHGYLRLIIPIAIVFGKSRSIIPITLFEEDGGAVAIRNAKEFGKAIRDRRKRLGYTQTELAEVCDVGVMFVSQLEGGKPTAQLEKAIRVANRVGLDLEFRERG